MTPMLAGRRAFVTGAGGGIGAAVAQRFCEEGARVVLADANADALGAVAAALDLPALTLDITDEAAVVRATDEAARMMDGLDTVIANAGLLHVGTVEETTPSVLRATFDVNLVGTVSCIRAALPHLRRAGGGSIVCSVSQAGIEGAPELTAYCASKFAVTGAVQSLARELGPEGIRVNGVAPGLVETPMLERFFADRARVRGLTPGQVREGALAGVPIGRVASPVEIANVIVFLASGLASYVSGVVLPILGGEISR
jgi:NAD(P)-dependent dehydrogenase (short-subunit alcohol dehydrogenase family)